MKLVPMTLEIDDKSILLNDFNTCHHDEIKDYIHPTHMLIL
jgi:hypothetical protein